MFNFPPTEGSDSQCEQMYVLIVNSSLFYNNDPGVTNIEKKITYPVKDISPCQHIGTREKVRIHCTMESMHVGRYVCLLHLPATIKQVTQRKINNKISYPLALKIKISKTTHHISMKIRIKQNIILSDVLRSKKFGFL